MKTHVDSGNSILQISMESQENTSANSIKSRPINQRKRLSPAQRRKQVAQEAVTLITQYGSYGFPMQALADAVGMTLPGLNHYVKNREELLSLVIETFYDSEEGNAHTQPSTTATNQIQQPKNVDICPAHCTKPYVSTPNVLNSSHYSCASQSKHPTRNTRHTSSTKTGTDQS